MIHIIVILGLFLQIYRSFRLLSLIYPWNARKGTVSSPALLNTPFCCEHKLPMKCFIAKLCTISICVFSAIILIVLLFIGNHTYFYIWFFITYMIIWMPAVFFTMYLFILSDISYKKGNGHIVASKHKSHQLSKRLSDFKDKEKEYKKEKKWLIPILQELRSKATLNRKRIFYLSNKEIQEIKETIMCKYAEHVYDKFDFDSKGRKLYKVVDKNKSTVIFWARIK